MNGRRPDKTRAVIGGAARVLLLVVLVGCGGGGGGSSGSGKVPFTTVSAIESGQVVQPQQGFARHVTVDIDGNAVDSIEGTRLLAANLVARFDDARELVAVSTGPFGVSLDATRPEIERRAAPADPRFLLFARAGNPLQRRASMADPNVAGLEHLLYGAWLNPSADIGFLERGILAASVHGTFTPATAVPTAGGASYQGAATGFLVSADGSVRDVSADVALNADFAAGSIAFSSGAARELETGASRPEFATTGTLVISSTRFDGTGTAANGWSGPVDGRFFGPAAEEVGGTLDLRGIRVERYLAAFGARQ